MRDLSPRIVALGVLVVVLLDGLLILGLSQLSGSLTLDGAPAAFGLALGLGILNGLLFFAASRLDLRRGTLVLGGFLAAINLIAVSVGAGLMPAAWVDVPGIVYTGGLMTLTTGLLIWLFSLDTESGDADDRRYARSRPGRTSLGSGR
jgi:hypothetical protein